MMSLNNTFNLFLALIIVVLAGFVAVPALRRLIRNIHLTRKGSVATGRYLGSNKVGFLLGAEKQIIFSTWRSSSMLGKKLEVLYDPERPEQAEVRSSDVLWFKPAGALAQAVGLVAMASALVLGVNSVLALCLSVACVVILWLLVRIFLILLVLLSLKYKLFSRVGMHVLAGLPLRTARKRPSGD